MNLSKNTFALLLLSFFILACSQESKHYEEQLNVETNDLIEESETYTAEDLSVSETENGNVTFSASEKNTISDFASDETNTLKVTKKITKSYLFKSFK